MKKLMLLIFVFFAVSFCSLAGGILLSGCEKTQVAEIVENSPENQEGSKDDAGQSGEDVTSQATYYYIEFGGARISDEDYPQDYVMSWGSIESDGTDYWSTRKNDTECGTVTLSYSGITVTNQDVGLAQSKTITSSAASLTFTLSFTVNDGYTFLGWFFSSYTTNSENDEEFRCVSTATTYSFTKSGSSSLDTNTSLDGYCGVFYKTYAPVVPAKQGFMVNANGGSTEFSDAYQISGISISYYGYGFKANSSGYFESQNAGVSSSYSMMRVDFSAQVSSASFTITYRSYGESSYDYAIFSNLDTALSVGNTADSSYYFRTYGASSSAYKTLTYSDISAGSHYIYIKYRKDASVNSYDDTLQVYFENNWNPSNNYKAQFVGLKLGTLPTASRAGYTFDGWWTAATGGTEVTSSTIVGTSTTTTYIYAHWIVNQYTVTLNKGAGISSVTGAGTYDYGSSVTITATVAKGYTFKNWTVTSGAVTISSSTSASTTFTMPANNIIIQANATANNYIVDFNTNGGTMGYIDDFLPNSDCTITNEGWHRFSINDSGGELSETNIAFLDARATIDIVSPGDINVVILITYDIQVTGSYVTDIPVSISVDGESFDVSTNASGTKSIALSLSAGTNSFNVEFYKRGGRSIDDYFSIEASFSVLSTKKIVTFASSYGTLPIPTRSYYTFAGWWTSASGGTQVLETDTYTTVGNQTLYAHWEPVERTVAVNLRYINADATGGTVNDSVGGSVTVTYYDTESFTLESNKTTSASAVQTAASMNYTHHSGQLFQLVATANSGYVFAGFSTSSTPSSTIKNPTSAKTTTASYYPTSNTTYYVYFKKVSDNRLKYDSTFKYFYFEDGEYPQTYAGTYDDLSSTLTSTGENIPRVESDGSAVSIPVYEDSSGVRYAVVTAPKTCTIKLTNDDNTVSSATFTAGTKYCFKFEPIRWRVSDYGVSSTEYPSGWSGYTSYNTDFTAVSDLILGFGAMSGTRNVSEGTAVSSMSGFINVQSTTSTCAVNDNFSVSSTSLIVDRYGVTANGEGNAVYTDSELEYTSPLRIASVEEIEELGINNKSARASHMVAMLMGQNDTNCSYWTRGLSNLGSGVAISATGTEIRSWLDVCQGIRFAYTFSEGSRV